MGPASWSGQYQRGIQIHEFVACDLDALQRLLQKQGRIGVFPLRIGGRKQRSNVGSGDGAEQRVGDRVQQNVAVGMAAESFVMRQSHASDFEWNTGLEFVRVPTVTDAHFRFQDLILSSKSGPQRLKPHSKQSRYRSTEALRHPKSSAKPNSYLAY